VERGLPLALALGLLRLAPLFVFLDLALEHDHARARLGGGRGGRAQVDVLLVELDRLGLVLQLLVAARDVEQHAGPRVELVAREELLDGEVERAGLVIGLALIVVDLGLALLVRRRGGRGQHQQEEQRAHADDARRMLPDHDDPPLLRSRPDRPSRACPCRPTTPRSSPCRPTTTCRATTSAWPRAPRRARPP